MARINGYPESVQPGVPKVLNAPAGWEQAPLGKYLKEVRRPVDLKDDKLYRLVTVKRARGGVVEREHLYGREIKVKTQFFVKEGDFLISKRQIVHGACGLVPPALDGAIVSNEYTVLRSSDDFFLPFLKYLSESVYFQQTCFHSSIGVHIEKMLFNTSHWLKWKFNIPPFNEQRRMYCLLSTWDRAIESTRQLVENSDARKTALTQLLIARKKQLPGFEFGDWRAVALKDVAEIQSSNVDKKSNSDELPVRLCNYTDVYHNTYISADLSFMTATATEREIEKFALRKGDVIITKDSETPDDIAVSAFVDDDLDGILCGYHLALIRPDEKQADGAFLNSLFSLKRTQNYFFTRANGATRFGLTVEAISEARVELPAIETQQKISALLRRCEQSTANQSRQYRLLKDEKRALMQQLLSGKRRVKVDKRHAA